MILQKNLSNSMKFIKASRHQSITEFSEELGISRSSLQTILKGNSNPRIDTIEYIASQLQIDPLVLLSAEKSYMGSAILVAQTLQAVSLLDPEEQIRFMELFQELAQLLNGGKNNA